MTGLRKGRGFAREGRIDEGAGVARRRQGGIPARARRLGRLPQAACAKGRNGGGSVQGDVPPNKAEARVGRVYP
ncbi:MAG: hypothetical protein ACFNYN_06475 [Peptidiphaga gingivicola]